MEGEIPVTAPVVLAVRPDVLVIRADPYAGPVDVLLDGRRLFSVRLEDHPAARIPWPEALRPHLRGRGTIALRRPGYDPGAEVTADLGHGGRFTVTDASGRDLVVNKWGRLGRALGDSDPGVTDRLLDHAEEVAAVLERDLGLEPFITGGTLLGAVREGRLLGHDDDVDLGYVSTQDDPSAVAREGFEVGRVLRRAGFSVLRHSAGHLQMHFSHDGVSDHYVDVFAGFIREGHWHQLFCIRHPARRADLLPRTTVTIAGRRMPAPADVELALEANYGPGWRVPDPAFRFETPLATRRRLETWFPGMHVDREDWALRPERDDVSARARRVVALEPGFPALDLGCGAGADTAFLADRLGRAVGLDWNEIALARARTAVVGKNADIRSVNFRDLRAVIRSGARLAAEEHGWVVLVGRLLTVLDEPARDNVLRMLGMVLRRGGLAVVDPGEASPRFGAQALRHGLVVEHAPHWLEVRRAPATVGAA
ncbi:class I SAM-dependent methyltransferase [Actinomycetospora termitidis]|uniref:Methyltransferase domain-containing protein n=1 Tax=Actinomycetospora termitidis TaxID=3053470 RepID=A0ABT7M1Y5_9PSEU|nr:class I SAM-dependent methyltransferase [Actinomycetospora sp. Odt1-22]MDL5154665.1 methyltransferase domain-containing protein [Actinomycetospora sp. Odt1-22]